jgi:hypothetical protein
MKNVSARLLWLQCVLLSAVSAAAQTGAVQTRPCKESPEYRGMDFWIGEWEVETAQGAPAGINKIELILDGCIVLENWTGKNGYAGRSFNLFHGDTSKWEQIWVDNQGQMTRYEGEAKDGNIYYRSERVDDGKKVPMKMTFIPKGPDQLRQFGEASADGGKTWTVEYDLLYKRKK